MPTPPADPAPPEPDIDLPADPLERGALRMLLLEWCADDVPAERRAALVDAIRRRDGLTWAAALAASRVFDEEGRASAIDLKAELLASASESQSAAEGIA